MKRELTFAREEFTPRLLGELYPLFLSHNEELITENWPGPIDIDVEAYVATHRAGMLHIYTARADGELVGYLIYFVRRHMHHKGLVSACQDLFFLAKDYRKGWAAINLLRFSEKELRKTGVQMIGQTCTVKNDVTKLYERMGYVCLEKIFTKRI